MCFLQWDSETLVNQNYQSQLPFACFLILLLQRYLTTNSYVFYEVANSYDLTRTI